LKYAIDDVMKLNLERLIPSLVGFLPTFKRLLPFLVRVFFVFERFIPVFVSYFLERTLKASKTVKSIDDYRTRIVRVGKSHYRIDVRLVLTEEQAKTVLNNLLTKILSLIGLAKANSSKVMVVTKAVKIERVDAEIDEISKRILLELESATSKDLSDVRYAKMVLHLSDIHYAKKVLQQISHTSEKDSEIEKRAVIKVLLFSTWLQRLYFIIRSFIMGLISAAATFLLILSVGSIDAIMGAVFGIFVFVFSLVITRLFDVQITKATKRIVELMASHRTVRDFIMNHF